MNLNSYLAAYKSILYSLILIVESYFIIKKNFPDKKEALEDCERLIEAEIQHIKKFYLD